MAKTTPPMGKELTDSSKPVLNTGKGNHMSSQNHAGKQKSLDTTVGGTAGGLKDAGGGFGSGGPQTGAGHMVRGQQHAGPQTPGQSGPGGLKKGGGGFGGGGVKGGSTKMFGPGKAEPQKPA